jgi:pyrroline-5-carboxylate reductase
MAMTADRPLVLVGAGNMGSAMLTGWLAAGMDPRTIVVIEPHPADIQPLHTPGLRLLPDAPDVVAGALVLAVKPQVFGTVLPKVAPMRGETTLVVSIAAGITLATLRTLGPGPLVRAIPNTPAAVGKGMTAAVAEGCSAAERAYAHKLLASMGLVAWIEDEALIDVATAVSGSGPAYVFHLVECLAAAGEAQGLPPAVAAKLARQTIIGAGALLERSPVGPDELRRNVTSPGGTTAAALAVLTDEGAMETLVRRAVDAATRRSRELGQ